MKTLFYLILGLFLTFTSCKKEEITPNTNGIEESSQIDGEIRLYGKWVLLDAKMYIENMETHEKTVFNHFDEGRTISSLRYSGPIYEIEVIEQYVTTWAFKQPKYVPGYGEFILNNDTIQPYGFYVTKSDWTIVEHPLSDNYDGMGLGGSARPIESYVVDYDDSIVNFYVQLAYENIDGWNCKYFTEMTMQKIEGW